jgi:hypothetical protein
MALYGMMRDAITGDALNTVRRESGRAEGRQSKKQIQTGNIESCVVDRPTSKQDTVDPELSEYY